MESIISFLITIAFYTFVFRAIKRLSGKGKKKTVTQKKKTITFNTERSGDTKAGSGFLKGLLAQTGLSQIMESLEEAQKKATAKQNNAQPFGASTPAYELLDEEEYEEVEDPYELKRYPEPDSVNVVSATKVKSKKKVTISQNDLKKAIIYSEIIAPPLAFRK